MLKGEGGGIKTPLLQNFARFDGGGGTLRFGWEGYKESRPWYSLFVGLPSLFFAPSDERLALLMCWKGTSLSTKSRVFVSIFFSGKNVVVDVEGVSFQPRAVVVGREVVFGCMNISSQEFSRYFQHAHFISILGVRKRGEY